MKKTFQLSCLAIILFSCSNKSSISPNPPPPPVNEIVASISYNGGAFISSTINASNTGFASTNDASGNLIIDITGYFQQGKLSLKLVNISTPGTYTINNGGSQYVLDTFAVGTGPNDIFTVPAPPPISGKLTVEECDAFKIKGSFYMTCTGPGGSVQVKNGTFNGKY